MSMRYINGVYLADTARVLGEVTLGKDVSIWYGVVIRGDVAPVTIGEGTNVQDNTVIHCDKDYPNVIGSHVTIGHSAICHGVAIGDGSMIGMGAKLLGGTKVGRSAIVAAGALLPQGMEVPDGHVAMGVPARVVRPINDREREYLQTIPPRYIGVARMHVEGNDPRVMPWIDQQLTSPDGMQYV